jgi:putative methionine-R-sulfoxide reductase with GAF domain
LIAATQQDIGTAGLDLDRVMKTICERSQELVHAAGAVVEFVEGDELVYRAVSGSVSNQVGLRISRATSLSGLCSRTGEILKSDDTATDSRVDQMACRAAHIRSMIVVPLKHEDKTPAVLKVLSDRVSAFNDDDVQALRLLAGLSAAAFSKAEEFRAKQILIDDLKEALTKVKTLGGLLPICSSCKKIRDDKGYWNQIELFIRDHSEANFTHGMCPECSEKMFPGMQSLMAAKAKSKEIGR